MNVVSHGLCTSSHRWTPEDRAIAERRVPLSFQADYATQDHADFASSLAGLKVTRSVRKQVRTRIWLDEHDERTASASTARPAYIAVLPAHVRHRWDVIAREQLIDRALALAEENDELRSKLRWAEDCAFMYEQEVEVMREGGRVGMTVHGRVVNLDASPGATIDDDPEYRA